MFLLDPICVMTLIKPIISKTHEISLNDKDIQDYCSTTEKPSQDITSLSVRFIFLSPVCLKVRKHISVEKKPFACLQCSICSSSFDKYKNYISIICFR